MTMQYASSIPAHATQVWSKEILLYDQKQRDSMVARNLAEMRSVGATVDTDSVTYFEGSGGNANLQATIVAKGAPPDVTSVKGHDVDWKMYQFAIGFMVNERDLNLDPTQKNRKVDWCTRQIRRLEDNTWINGHTATNQTGLDSAAGNNPNGKIVASGASGNDANNVGNWAGSDTNIDIYEDVRAACDRIGDNFTPKYLLGRRTDLGPIRKLDDMRQSYADELLDLFGAVSTADFLRYSAYTPSTYVYVVAQDMDFCEFVVSEELRVDTDYAKMPGGNYYVELKEWINPVEFHDYEGVVEIATA